MKLRRALQGGILAMAIAGGAFGALAVLSLYRSAIESERARLTWIAKSEARTIAAALRNDVSAEPDLSRLAGIAAAKRMRDYQELNGGLGDTGAVMVGRRLDDSIEIICSRFRQSPAAGPSDKFVAHITVPVQAADPDPMREALAGRSGTMIASGLHGREVLAAYEPVGSLGLGLVATIDVAEIRAPYVKAAVVMLGPSVILILAVALIAVGVGGQAMARAEESARRFRNVVANMPGVVYQRRRLTDGKVVYPLISDGVRELYGLEPAEVMTEPDLFRNAIHPDDREAYWVATMESERTGQPLLEDVRIVATDGTVKWVHVRARPDRISEDEVVWDGVITDITDRKTAERRLKESERRYRYVTESASDAIVSIDARGFVRSWNAGAERMLGYRSDEILGRSLELLVPERDRERHRRHFEKMRDGGTGLLAAVVLTKDNREIHVEVTYGALRAGGEVFFTLIGRDVTERLRIEEEKLRLASVTRQAQKLEALGTLAGGIAHDVNNTLVPILGLTALMIEDLPEGDAGRANLEMILAAGQRIRRLVQQILAFSREEETSKEIVDLLPLVEGTVDLLRSTIPTTVRIESNLAPVRVQADATAIHQILMNLSINGADAMAETGGVLTIALDQVELDRQALAELPDLTAGRYARLSVSDTGAGMTRATMARIFEPFFTTKPVGAGTGMGLAVVHGVVKAHGGGIAVTSELGQGTTFQVFFPVASPEGVGEPEERDQDDQAA